MAFRDGDGRFAARARRWRPRRGWAGIGTARVFEQPHTGGNYLMREMIHVVGRRHALKLRVIAVVAVFLPALILVISDGPAAIAVALACHLVGAFAARWLFFAEAEHVVGLYYGKR